ncbi:MAG TPA: hypothetical protein VD994_02580, partial [Prosthecobacter sp.]|nr:hypothetical protein [Prosthecobacter sp.]
KIGNGDDPDNNLYWGCDDGLRSYFKRSKQWRFVSSEKKAPPAGILEQCLFKHRQQDVWLVAHAYRGAEIRQAVTDFFGTVAGAAVPEIGFEPGEAMPALHEADLAAFIGHNGLMDFTINFPPNRRQGAPLPAVVLCCKSDAYFTAVLRQCGGDSVLMTRQLMYPGSFLLHAALEGWLAKEKPPLWLDRAARAYATNQRISIKAARGIFVVP